MRFVPESSKATTDRAGNRPQEPSWKSTGGVAAATLALFAIKLTVFTTSVTDLSALRVLDGDVPYRDFWTMYAPGSIYSMAAGFALFGRELIVSHLLGVLTAIAAVAALHRVLLAVTRPVPACIGALLYASAFFHAGYQNALASYPLSILFIWLGAGRLIEYVASRRRSTLLAAGVFLGLAVCSKHDLGGYACLAGAATLLLGGTGLGSVSLLAATVLGVVLIPLTALIAAGAGGDMLNDLVVFPLTDFKHVRQEYFPILPRFGDHPFPAFVNWATLNLPSLALAAGVIAGWRRRRSLQVAALPSFVFAVTLYALSWMAAHVQINTHVITLTGLGVWIAAAGVWPRGASSDVRRKLRIAGVTASVIWALILLVGPAGRSLADWRKGLEPVGLQGLHGIRVPPGEADWMRGLSEAIRRAGPSEAPLLLVGRRNDVLIYASSQIYWLSQRRMVTRHQELHPAVTDTEVVQRRMVADLEAGPPPIIVREHRFPDAKLDRVGADFRAHGVPVGSTLLDEWIARHYDGGERYGMYEVMQRK